MRIAKRNRKKGSLTVEAAFICPIFIIAMIVLIGIINWFSEAEKAQQALAFGIRDRVVINTLLDSEKNDDSENYVTLRKLYRVGSFPAVPGIHIPTASQMAKERTFIGTESLFPDDDDPIVYITPSGRVAHTDRACTYIKVKIKSYRVSSLISARNRSGAKYHACSRCAATVKSGDTVYITDYGTKYHSDKSCTAIFRNVIAVRYSQVKGMALCSKCSEGVHFHE